MRVLKCVRFLFGVLELLATKISGVPMKRNLPVGDPTNCKRGAKMGRRWRTGTAAVLGVTLFGVPPAGASGGGIETLASERAPTGVTAYRGRVVWSSLNPRTGRFSLMAWAGGRRERLPVRSRAVPFDVDLGPGPDGATWVVYSRCAREPSSAEPSNGLPDYSSGTRCRLFRFSFEDGKERRLPTSGRPERSEFVPTIWRGRLAFGRISRPDERPRFERAERRDALPRLFVRALRSGAERVVRLPVRKAFRDASVDLLTGTDL